MKPEEKRKPGRPPGTCPPPKYTTRIQFMVTPQQLAHLRDMAASEGMDVSSYIRWRIGLES